MQFSSPLSICFFDKRDFRTYENRNSVKCVKSILSEVPVNSALKTRWLAQ